MTIYVVGAKKGLGRYLSENIDCTAIYRNNFNKIKNSKKNIFIICANNKNKYPPFNDVFDFYSDNIYLIQKISDLKHKQIIFMSSVEVYNSDNQFEDTNIICNHDNPYAISKIISESILINKTKKCTILRLAALLGKYSNNTISKILIQNVKKTTLSKESTFNYIMYEDVLSLIKKLVIKQKMGIFNVVSNKNIKLEDAMKILNKKIQYGRFKYITHNINNNKINNFTNLFNNSSDIKLKKYINAHSKRKTN
ncbi:NAD-dependent epimerase/dehydratase family protein [Pelagibacteraceae bacterium]|nr:NAD-dependent epimerase/dehydratase family protein [Pelagibacteraceae bacterium]